MMALANDNEGAYLDAGTAVTLGGDCGGDCDTSGYTVEAGYNFNKILGIDIKRSVTEYEHYEDDKLESMSAKLFENTLGYGQLTVGYQF